MRVNVEGLVGTSFEDMHCWHVVREIYKRHDIDLEDYHIGVDECEAISKVYAEKLKQEPGNKWERLTAPEPLALVAIRNHPKFVSHCGVCIGNGQFIHSLADTGVIINRLSDPMWRKKIVGFYRYVG